VTDAEAAPDGRTVAVRTSDDLVIYRTADLAAGGTPPSAFRISVEALQEPQGEGVALGADGLVFLASEGRLWERRGQLSALRCTIPG
jgi:hypothetical protein